MTTKVYPVDNLVHFWGNNPPVSDGWTCFLYLKTSAFLTHDSLLFMGKKFKKLSTPWFLKVHSNSRVASCIYSIHLAFLTGTPYKKEIIIQGMSERKSGTTPFLSSSLLHLKQAWGGSQITRRWDNAIVGRRHLKEETKRMFKDRNTPLLPSSLQQLPSSLCKHFLFLQKSHDWVTTTYGYDTQQQVLVLGGSSSMGCFSLSRGGSPLAGV